MILLHFGVGIGGRVAIVAVSMMMIVGMTVMMVGMAAACSGENIQSEFAHFTIHLYLTPLGFQLAIAQD